jgi:branched-chain amino acid transport system substrate-binding protein
MGFQPDYHTEGSIYAKHILANVKDAKIGVLMQNDDYGKDYWNGMREGLGKEANRVVKHVTYEVTDPTVESQIIQLKDSGANVLFNITTPKFAAQAIRKSAELGWKPAQYLNNVSASVAAVLKPAGFDNSQGIITASYLKDPTDKQWDDAADMKAWRAFMAKNMPNANTGDGSYAYAYCVAHLMVETLKRCGDELTRANVMKQSAGFHNFPLPLLLPGISISTSATDFYPIQAVQLARFKGESWDLFGDVMHAESS